MTDLQLTRSAGDRRLYTLEGVGTLRLTGWGAGAGVIEADGVRWQIGRPGFWRRVTQATDAGGVVVGEFTGRAIRGGGALRWAGRELDLRREGTLRSRYLLQDGGRELARIDVKTWGKRPGHVTVGDTAAIDPGLLLFAVYVARALEAAAAAAAAGAGAGVS